MPSLSPKRKKQIESGCYCSGGGLRGFWGGGGVFPQENASLLSLVRKKNSPSSSFLGGKRTGLALVGKDEIALRANKSVHFKTR